MAAQAAAHWPSRDDREQNRRGKNPNLKEERKIEGAPRSHGSIAASPQRSSARARSSALQLLLEGPRRAGVAAFHASPALAEGSCS